MDAAKTAVFLPENDALQVEGVLYDSCSGDAHPEYILLCGKIVGIWNTIQIRKITTNEPVRKKEYKKKEGGRGETGKQLYKAWQAITATPQPFQESVDQSCWRRLTEKAASQKQKGVSATAPPTLFPELWH